MWENLSLCRCPLTLTLTHTHTHTHMHMNTHTHAQLVHWFGCSIWYVVAKSFALVFFSFRLFHNILDQQKTKAVVFYPGSYMFTVISNSRNKKKETGPEPPPPPHRISRRKQWDKSITTDTLWKANKNNIYIYIYLYIYIFFKSARWGYSIFRIRQGEKKQSRGRLSAGGGGDPSLSVCQNVSHSDRHTAPPPLFVFGFVLTVHSHVISSSSSSFWFWVYFLVIWSAASSAPPPAPLPPPLPLLA